MRKQKGQTERSKTLDARMSEYYRLGQWLRTERLRAGLGQREVNRLLGASNSFMYRVENGRQRLDLVQFFDLARVIGIDPSTSLKAMIETVKS